MGTTLPMACARCSEPAGLLPQLHFLFAQSATDIAQIRELQTQVEDVKKEKQSLQEKVIPPHLVAPRAEEREPAGCPLASLLPDAGAVLLSETRPGLCCGGTKPFLLWKTVSSCSDS